LSQLHLEVAAQGDNMVVGGAVFPVHIFFYLLYIRQPVFSYINYGQQRFGA
jgi:hypothetical protein